jgi:DNA-binding transcriptional LysR family regulator
VFSEIPIKRLDGEKFIGFERDIATRRALDRILRRNGVKVQYVMEMDNIETIKRGVEIGAGISIVPEPAVGQEIKNETLIVVQLADEILTRPLGIISKRGRRFTPAVQEFIDFLRGKMTRTPIQETDRIVQGLV